MIVDNESSCSPYYDSMLALVRDLLEAPGGQVSLERSAGRSRLRFNVFNAEAGIRTRRSLELPDDDKFASSITDIIQSHRHARRVSRHRHADERKIV